MKSRVSSVSSLLFEIIASSKNRFRLSSIKGINLFPRLSLCSMIDLFRSQWAETDGFCGSGGRDTPRRRG